MKSTKYMFLAVGLLIGIAIGYFLFSGVGNNKTATNIQQTETDQHEDEETVVDLSEIEIEELGIKIKKAGKGTIELNTTLSGEISIDPIWVSHLKPRYPGVVKKININILQLDLQPKKQLRKH